MSSWASVAKATVQPTVAPKDLTASTEGLRLLVVDANAIIGGVRLEGIADRAITIQEVGDEIRDKQSRQFLASLPYQLQISEPTEESIKIVTRFARETGDVSTLSTNDMKLLALAYTLEVAAHGSTHLATHAAQPRMHSGPISAGGSLPGWGSVPNPEDWRVVDEANEADETAAAASTSRISQQVQQLSLDPSQPNSFLMEEQPLQQQQEQQPAQQHNISMASDAAGSSQEQTAAAAQQSAAVAPATQQPAAKAYAPPAAAAVVAAAADDDGWEVAASSAAAARRKKKKEYRRAEKQRAFEAEWEEHALIMQQQQQQQQQQQHFPAGFSSDVEQQQNGVPAAQQENDAAADTADADADPDRGARAGQSHSGSDDEPEGDEEVTNDELLAAEHQIYTAEDMEPAAVEPSSSGSSSQQQHHQQDGLAPGMPGWQSSVACITADFAMQNVMLQMGLRLLTRDGRRIARVSRYALRCSACFTVTREPGRLFCPKCGNMTLDRVEVVVGADGAEYFGIKKKHILRGTRFSLPKPRGGRNSKDPVLREDIFLLKVKALGRRAAKKKAAAAAGDAAGATADPFAPEYSQDTWHVASQAELAQHRGLTAVLQPAWKSNPNERKLTRSNRRG